MKSKKVLHWDDERALGNSLIVTLARGWAFSLNDSANAEHVEGFDTVRAANAAVRAAKPCACFDCK